MSGVISRVNSKQLDSLYFRCCYVSGLLGKGSLTKIKIKMTTALPQLELIRLKNQLKNQLKNIHHFDYNKDIQSITKSISTPVFLSVVVTNYNYSAYLNRCLESIVESSFKNIEIILIDDCSTDNSLNIIKEYLSEEINITFLKKNINTGLLHSRNIGIENSKGDYVFILDADNFIYKNCLQEHYDLIEKEKCDAVYGIIDCFTNNIKVSKISEGKYDLNKLKSGNYIDSMALYRRSTLVNIGCYEYEIMKYGVGWEDYELWIKLGLNGYNILNIDKSLSYYEKKEDSMISSTNYFIKELTGYIQSKYFNANI